MRDLDWSDVRVLLALARHRHMTDAGRSLGVNATTILRRVAVMERALGCPVFHRASDGWALTPAGARLLPMAQAMEASAASLQRAAAMETTDLRGVVRVSAPELLSSEFLIPLLPQVRARFPEVAIELNATNRLVSLSRRDADLAFRLNRPKEAAVVGRRLVRVTSALVAAASYLRARGSPTAKTAPVHDFVWDTAAFDDSLEGVWRKTHAPGGRVVFRSDSAHARCAAAEAGLGLTFLPRYVVDACPTLERVTSLPELPPRELWLVVHREFRRHLPVRAIATVLSELVVANRAKVEV